MSSMQASKTGIRFSLRRPLAHPQGCTVRAPLHNQQRSQSTLSNLYNRAQPHLPRILQPDLWNTVVPASLRTKTRQLFADRRKKQINPATFFIWIYLLIGSQSIRIIQTKNDAAIFSRKADLQIEKLREVVRKLQAGEEVDVETALGAGIPEEEQAWEDAIREIEQEEKLWSEAKQKKKAELEKQRLEAAEHEKLRYDASPVNEALEPPTSSNAPLFRSPGFY